MPDEHDMKDQSRWLHSLGLATFPLIPKTKLPHKGSHGFKDATLDDGATDRWYERHPNDNIGIATGKYSGDLVIVDLDVDESKGEDGIRTLREWESEHGEFPETVTAATGRGGRHYYFRCPGIVIGCYQNKDAGVDVRGHGGFAVAPPSMHENGNRYEWLNHPDGHKIAEADANVLAFVEAHRPGGGKRTGDGESKPAKFRLPDKISDGNRNGTLHKFACSLQSKGVDDETIMQTVEAVNIAKCDPPLPDHEIKKIVDSALTYDKGSGIYRKRSEVSLMLTGNGGVQQTIENAKRVLTGDDALAGRFKYNQIAYQKTVVLPLPWDNGSGERPVADWDYCALASYMEREYGLMSKSKAIDAVTEVTMQQRFNPITEWLDSLEWDGDPRIDTLLPCFLGCEPSDYNVSVMRLFMQGAVTRAYEPGTKFDYMPVLVGKQGLGKSYFLRLLGHCSDWYCDNFNTVEGDAASEKLRGMWIVELAELLATKKQKDVESIKAFITSTVDTFRPKYGRETEQRPRACVFAGTTNNQSFLTDATGNRRFLPVTCGVTEPPMSMFSDDVPDHFDQAWAEAVYVYKWQRPPLVLSDEASAYALEQQEAYLEDDPRVGMIQQYLDAQLDIEMGKMTPRPSNLRVCAQEIIEEALSGTPPTRFLINEVHTIMSTKIEGWMKYPKSKGKAMTKKYGVQRCYVPKCAIETS